MTFIDTHTHIYDEAFAGEEGAAIRRAREAGVDILIQPDVDSGERDAMFSLCDKYPGILFPMLGLYPGSVGKNWKEEFKSMLGYRDRKVVAIGEIGLDYHYGADFAEEQKEAFRLQLELAAEMDLPVNIHLREATEDFFKIMDECSHLHLRGSLHAFSGSVETFRRVRKYGEWYVGIGGVVTFKKASLAETVRQIPLENIILETDSPYLTPVPYRGTRNESIYIPVIAAKIAELKNIGTDEVAEMTTLNAKRLFRI